MLSKGTLSLNWLPFTSSVGESALLADTVCRWRLALIETLIQIQSVPLYTLILAIE